MIQYLLILAVAVSSFSKSEFFKALESGNQTTIVAMEKKIGDAAVTDDQKAYHGAIVMKTSEYEKTAGDKLKKFKEGKALLEGVIQTNSSNIEYRFLRLMIQENAPKILKYNTNIKSDVAFIKENMNKATKEIKTAITNYSAVSANLKLN